MRDTVVPVVLAAFVAATALAQPDVIVRAPSAVTLFGEVGGVRAYGVGFDLCNLGSAPAMWDCCSNLHPVTAHNLYRLSNGRFEQIGMSWATHEIFPLQGSVCGFCAPASGGLLGAGCSTPTSASAGAAQTRLGPRSEINASTGVFAFPFGGSAPEPVIGRRLQVRAADLDSPGALWFIESIVVSPDDAAANRADNNATYRRATVGASPALALGLTGEPQVGRAAVYAWRDNALGPGAPSDAVRVAPFSLGDGSLFLASTASAAAGGVDGGPWEYEYALENLNSDRGVRTLHVFIPQGAAASNVGFHDADYHSGEPYSGADWQVANAPPHLSWSALNPSTPNANAIRWGTLYNFRYTCDAPPVYGGVRVHAYKPVAGLPASVVVPAVVPGPACPDIDFDGLVTFVDLNIVLGNFGATGLAVPGDFNGDQRVDFGDLNIALGAFGSGCAPP